MPIVYDIRKLYSYQKGKKEAAYERNVAIIKNLLQHTSHPIEEIARLVGVSKTFVKNVQKGAFGKV